MISIRIDSFSLNGILALPKGSSKIVLFVHGSGSGRFSPRNQFVSKYLNDRGLATLLLDLLTADEEAVDETTREFRFNIPLLAERVIQVTKWLQKEAKTQKLSIGYFGASTGAAAALIAAAQLQKDIFAIVSRGGRPDLAGSALVKVHSPTLLIVGGDDAEVLELNRSALQQIRCKKQLSIVPHATHLFEEEGALEEAARLAYEWFSGKSQK